MPIKGGISVFDLNNLSAEERLEKIPELMRIIHNKEIEERTLQAEADKIAKKRKKCAQEIDEAKLELGTLEEIIEAMPTRKYKEMLKWHYIDDQTWQSIAEAIRYSEGQVYRFRPLAINEFDDKWNEKMK